MKNESCRRISELSYAAMHSVNESIGANRRGVVHALLFTSLTIPTQGSPGRLSRCHLFTVPVLFSTGCRYFTSEGIRSRSAAFFDGLNSAWTVT